MNRVFARKALAIVLVGYLAYFLWDYREEVLRLGEVTPTGVALLSFLIIITILLQSLRFSVVLTQSSGVKVPFLELVRIDVLGRFLSTLVPQSGNLYRSLELKQEHGVSHTRYVATYLSFVWIEMVMNLLLALLTIAIVNPGLAVAGAPALAIVVVAMTAVAGGPVIAEQLTRRARLTGTSFEWVRSKASEALSVAIEGAKHPSYLFRLALLGLTNFIVTVAAYEVYFQERSIAVDLASLSLFFVLLRMSTLVTLTPGNLGIRELAFGLLSASLGIGLAEGILASVVLRVLGTLLLMLIGIALGGADLWRRRDHFANASKRIRKL